jgi:hypothetical protein
MKIVRYSNCGFTPQFQKHHLSGIDYELNEFDIAIYPDHLKHHILLAHEKLLPFWKEHYQDFIYGIWVFIDGHECMQSLNHLSIIPKRTLAEIDDSTIVYDVNWERQLKITDEICQYFGCYIPESQLGSIRNN